MISFFTYIKIVAALFVVILVAVIAIASFNDVHAAPSSNYLAKGSVSLGKHNHRETEDRGVHIPFASDEAVYGAEHEDKQAFFANVVEQVQRAVASLLPNLLPNTSAPHGIQCTMTDPNGNTFTVSFDGGTCADHI